MSSIMTTSRALTLDVGQITRSTVVAFTVYRIQTIEICAPTPTRSPTLTVLTSLPTLIALPTISCPTQMGSGQSPQPPLMVWTSLPQTPQQSMAMSMSRSSKGLSLNCVRRN